MGQHGIGVRGEQNMDVKCVWVCKHVRVCVYKASRVLCWFQSLMWSSRTESDVLNTLCSQGEGKRSSRGAQFPSVWGSCSERMCVGGLTDDVMTLLWWRRDAFSFPAEVKMAPLTCNRGMVSFIRAASKNGIDAHRFWEAASGAYCVSVTNGAGMSH